MAELSIKANPSKGGDAKPLGLTSGHLPEKLARLPKLVREHPQPALHGLQAFGALSARAQAATAWQFFLGGCKRMWTLYDPMTRPAHHMDTSDAIKMGPAAAPSQDRRTPSTVEKLWFLLEPTSPLTRRSGLKPKAN